MAEKMKLGNLYAGDQFEFVWITPNLHHVVNLII